MSPLYLYPNTDQLNFEGTTERVPNLNMEIVEEIAKSLGLTFTSEKLPSSGGVPAGRGGNFSPDEPAGNSNDSNPTIPRNTQNYMSLPYNPVLKERARELRKAGNLSEILFWNQVKNKQFKGLDFDRQKIIGNYIVDFYCANCNVVVEIDGKSHDNKVEYDAERDAFLEGIGLTVIHIPVVNIMKRMEEVMRMLEEHEAFELPRLADTSSEEGKIPPRQSSTDTPPKEGKKPPRQSSTDTPLKEGKKPPRQSSTDTPPEEGNFAPIDILDYIYAVLHSPTYREKYKEFLKIDFPRVPYPKDKDTFWQLVKLGEEIRQIHLLESPTVEQYITQYPIDGDNVVIKPRFDSAQRSDANGRVYINDTQYFDNVPETAWNFYIGGYQPAQKWLKDRKDRKLEFEDILHYQKIIVALCETDRLMKEIDMIEIE